MLLGATAFAHEHSQNKPCPHGQLSASYCDRNLDLEADLPLKSDHWLDPEVLTMSYTPVDDPAKYIEIWSGFSEHLAKVTGKEVRWLPIATVGEQLAALREGRLHISGVNTGAVPLAVNCSGFNPFAVMTRENGDFGYRMIVIAAKKLGVSSLADIKGKKVTFTKKSSNSGYKAPSALIKQEQGYVVGEDFSVDFSGRHDKSIMGIASGKYQIAAVADSIFERLIRAGKVKREDFSIIYSSSPFPTTAYGHIHNLNPLLVAKIKEAFWTYPWNKHESFAKAYKRALKFSAVSYKNDWAVIRKIDTANEVSYTCSAS